MAKKDVCNVEVAVTEAGRMLSDGLLITFSFCLTKVLISYGGV